MSEGAPLKNHTPARPEPGMAVVSIAPSAATALLGRELRSYAHLVRAGLPGQGSKRAALRLLGRLSGRSSEVEACLAQISASDRKPTARAVAAPGR